MDEYSNGWVKLHRQLLNNPVAMKDADHLAVWVYLLLNATHKKMPMLFKGKRITLKPGQLITGRKKISCDLVISESKVSRILETLKIEQQIEQQTSNKNRLITIVNWEKYQETEQQNEQQVNNNRTTSEQQVNTNKNDKNVKNDKNREKRARTRETPSAKLINAYCVENEIDAAIGNKFFSYYDRLGWVTNRGTDISDCWKDKLIEWNKTEIKKQEKPHDDIANYDKALVEKVLNSDD